MTRQSRTRTLRYVLVCDKIASHTSSTEQQWRTLLQGVAHDLLLECRQAARVHRRLHCQPLSTDSSAERQA